MIHSPKNRMNRLGSIDQDVLRTSTRSVSNYDFSLLQNKQQDARKLIETLEKIAKQEKKTREQVEIKYQQFQQRNIYREKEFYKILAKFDATGQSDNINKEQLYITQIYQKILHTFQAFNEKARQLLQDRYTELYRLMERRIDILMQKMDKQLRKYRRLTEKQLKDMRDEIKQMAIIAAQIESENIDIRKNNQLLELKNKLLNEQKKLLLKELNHKKYTIHKEIKKNQLYKMAKSTNKCPETQQFQNNIGSIQLENPEAISFTPRKISTARNYRYQQKTNANNNLSNKKTVSKFEMERQFQTLKSTINHLKICLERQRIKNCQIIKFSLQLQNKQSNIKNLINRVLQSETFKSISNKQTKPTNSNSSQLQNTLTKNLIKNQKLIRIIDDEENQNTHIYQDFKPKISNQTQTQNLLDLICQLNKIIHLPQHQIHTADQSSSSIKSLYNQNFTTINLDRKKSIEKSNYEEITANFNNLNKHSKQDKQFDERVNVNFLSISGVGKNTAAFNTSKSAQKKANKISYRYKSKPISSNASPIEQMDFAQSIQM